MADFVTTALGTSEVAHAIKAPLITIEKALSLLREPSTGPLTDTQQKFLSIADRNLRLVTTVMADFLDLARIDAGNMKLLRRQGAVDTTADRVAQEAQAPAATKNVAVAFKKPNSALPTVAFDPSRLAQAIAQVVNHALSVTPEGRSVTIAVRARASWVDVAVTADGVTLPPDVIAQMFERHIPADGKADVASLGLGLPLAKGLIELHQGRIAAASDGASATWTLSLPVEKGAAPTA